MQRLLSNAGVLFAAATVVGLAAIALVAGGRGLSNSQALALPAIAAFLRASAPYAIVFCGGIVATMTFQWFVLRKDCLPAALLRALAPDEVERSGQRLGAQLTNALDAFKAHSESAGRFAQSLTQGRDRLRAAEDATRAESVVRFLVEENDKMIRANDNYQRQLVESAREIDALRAELLQAKAQNECDALTGVASRRHFDQTLALEVDKAAREGTDLSLVMADVDHFKRLNDTHGHIIGDEFLKQIAAMLEQNTKGKDCVARYGGEEFAIIMPATPLSAAAAVAEQIRTALAAKRWKKQKDGSMIGAITASFGVAQLAPRESAQSLVERADAKLYASKNAGRNRVTK